MACAKTPSIRTWNASLYDNASQKWKHGLLNLTANAIHFMNAEGIVQNQDENLDPLFIDFFNVTSINKALSSFVFPAITVITKDGNISWFSSFQNRNSTFLILQHFFQASLHQKPLHSGSGTLLRPSSTVEKRTKFGTELLHSVQDSQSTLQKAAVSLIEQGHQLRSASLTMEELHEDLDVAERITSGINSYLGRWALPPTNKAEELILVTSNDIPDVLDIEVLYTQVTATKIGTQLIGVLRISKEGVTILDLKQKVVQLFKWLDVSRIRVVSPWEILVTKFMIGQSDLSYNVLSMTMPKVLIKLSIFAARKMEYMNPPETHHEHRFESFTGHSASRPGHTVTHADSNGETTPTFGHPGDTIRSDSDLQQVKLVYQELITDSEVSELSAALSGLKSLALDIRVEQDSQMETIDNLTESVTRGSDRLRTVNSKIDKLAK